MKILKKSDYSQLMIDKHGGIDKNDQKAVGIVLYMMIDEWTLLAGNFEKMAVEINIEITKTEANVAIVAFRSPSMSDVDAITATSAKIQEYVKENQPRVLVFDFEAVKFFSSLVLGLLLDIRGKMTAHNGEVMISSIDPQLHRVFKITSLDKVFKFFPDRQEAIEAAQLD